MNSAPTDRARELADKIAEILAGSVWLHDCVDDVVDELASALQRERDEAAERANAWYKAGGWPSAEGLRAAIQDSEPQGEKEKS